MLLPDTYAKHIAMLAGAEIILATFRRKLLDMEQQYQKQVEASEAAGFLQDYTEQLKQRQQRLAMKVDALTHFIERSNRILTNQTTMLASLKDIAQRRN
jgi:hypothetical protein